MGKALISFVFVCTLAIACSTPTQKRTTEDIQQIPANSNFETKTNTSSSAAKANEASDSTTIIRPVHKYKHQKKYKIK